jgi:hypothetical protein
MSLRTLSRIASRRIASSRVVPRRPASSSRARVVVEAAAMTSRGSSRGARVPRRDVAAARARRRLRTALAPLARAARRGRRRASPRVAD